jgi:hypothetical protein
MVVLKSDIWFHRVSITQRGGWTFLAVGRNRESGSDTNNHIFEWFIHDLINFNISCHTPRNITDNLPCYNTYLDNCNHKIITRMCDYRRGMY